MSTPAENVKNLPALPKLNAGQAFIVGRIEARTKLGKTWIHLIVGPAKDEYSFPDSFEVSSRAPLGEVGELVRLVVQVSGRRTRKTHTDKDTGERKEFPGAFVSLRAIEE